MIQKQSIECTAVIDGDFFPEDPTKKDFVNRVPCLLGQGQKDTLSSLLGYSLGDLKCIKSCRALVESFNLRFQ